ncbi:MAG: cyclic lactone autoinducer peptide [Sulfurospirillum sp.]|nr:cyclic lactone autoinducer peptide [Sulfurospirillum sp.]
MTKTYSISVSFKNSFWGLYRPKIPKSLNSFASLISVMLFFS